MRLLILLITVLAGSVHLTNAIIKDYNLASRFEIESILFHGLLKDYDPRVRPQGVGSLKSDATEVFTQTYVRLVYDVNTRHNEYSTQITFRQVWNDSRLAFGDPENPAFKWLKNEYPQVVPSQVPGYIVLHREHHIWKPDTFFNNEKEGHRDNLDQENILVKVFANGTILYSTRINQVNWCVFDMTKFPRDTQTCKWQFGSYSYTSEHVRYHWHTSNPLALAKELESCVPEYTMTITLDESCAKCFALGCYSCGSILFTFQRHTGYYHMHVYWPSFFVIALSWVQFWLSSEQPQSRIAFSAACLGAFVLQSMAIHIRSNHSTALTALDVWIGSNYMFLISALAETLAVCSGIEMLDRFSKVGFPAAFFSFVIIYWIVW